MSQINFPNSPSDGEEFLASNGTTYRYDSSTGQWKILSGPGVQGPAGNTGPTGSIIMWGTSTLPEGYIECNGQSTSGYTALAALYGSNVPDLRGEFVRGWDNGKGTDSGRALLGSQGESFKSHTHTQNSHNHSQNAHNHTQNPHKHTQQLGGTISSDLLQSGSYRIGNANSASVSNTTATNKSTTATNNAATATNQSTGDTETRPRNISLMYIIKT
ncbi:tail collar domain protein [Synechococcus phage ACG-2014f]|uniref:Tail collar domain protein n=1 Tax=Synechococcus phage ACG-2014f TaxID=1493511 RepID=A0A0E3FWZ7_9CAUD|nr:tail collar domain protein [Synechococcus phage ACG-2014f]AIX37109.1 tail collar domain protein [Synechococcus phage ACG-2014f]